MSNFSIVANAQFNPFSYQELLAPVLHQQQVQDQLAEQYDKLSSQADILEAMGANDKNSKAYWNFKNYSDSLRAEADNLYRNGLNSESRLRLSELKRRYNSEIVPIQNAWNKRKEEADFQMKASISNPMLRFTRSAANSGIDYYLDNPEGGYGVINLANIASQAGAAFKNLEKQIRGGIKIEGIDATTNAIIQKKGLTPDMINEWLNNPAKNPAMTNIVNQVLATNGLTEDAIRSNPNLMAEATQAAQSGAWNAIGEDKIQLSDNYIGKKEIDYRYWRRQKADEAAMAAAQAENSSEGNYPATSMYTMPIKEADFSGAKEQEKAIETLGYAKNSRGSYVSTGKVKVKDMEVSVFNKDGKVKTRKEFVAQAGNNQKNQKALNEYFDKMLAAGQTIGMKGVYTQKELSARYNQNRENSAAGGIDVLPLNYDSSAWNSHSKNYKAREIKDYRGGKVRFNTEQISINDLLNKKDKNKNTLNVSPYWTNLEGQEGLLLTTVEDGEDHRYFIPADEMPDTNIREAREAFKAADEAHKNGNTPRENYLRGIGLRRLHLGLTLDNSPAKQSMVQFPTRAQQINEQ